MFETKREELVSDVTDKQGFLSWHYIGALSPFFTAGI